MPVEQFERGLTDDERRELTATFDRLRSMARTSLVPFSEGLVPRRADDVGARRPRAFAMRVDIVHCDVHVLTDLARGGGRNSAPARPIMIAPSPTPSWA